MSAPALAGYAQAGYAASLSEFGSPRYLPGCGGWILTRPVGAGFPGGTGIPGCDAMGPYPLFACRDWKALPDDLAALEGELVSLTLVSDPFGDYHPADLQAWFPHLARPFKDHYVVDLSQPQRERVARRHAEYARAARRELAVQAAANLPAFLDGWTGLYQHLVARHGLGGLHAFSRPAFAQQLALPGMHALAAYRGDELVGAHLWIEAGPVAYSHLVACSPAGYERRAAYALYSFALEYFQERVRWLDLGAGAGLEAGQDGLSRFKRGWASGVRPVYLCGRIFDPERYTALTRQRGQQASTYFPAYRTGEFG